MACDELALRITDDSAGNYGALLLKVAIQDSAGRRFGFAAFHGNDFPHALKRRLIAMSAAGCRTRQGGMIAGAMLALIACATLPPWRVVAAKADGLMPVTREKRAAFENAAPLMQDFMKGLDDQRRDILNSGLDEEQSAKVRSVFERMKKRIAEADRDESLSRLDKARAMKKTVGEEMESVKGILTPEQWNRVQPKRKTERVGAPTEDLINVLLIKGDFDYFSSLLGDDLTQDQAIRMRKAFLDCHQRALAVVGDGSLSQQEAEARILDLEGVFKAHVLMILTPDQLEILASRMRLQRKKPLSAEDGLLKIDALAQSAKAVNLDGPQAEKWKAIVEKTKDDLRLLFSNDSLSVSVKAEGMKRGIGAMATQLDALLTPEQRDRWHRINAAGK
jgi:hypothetical protein